MHRDEEGRNWSRRYKLNLEKLASKDLASVSEVIDDLELRDLETGLTLTGPCCRGLGSRTAVAGGRQDPGPRPRCPEPAGAVVYDAERQEPVGRGLSPSCLRAFGILGPGLCGLNHGRKEERPARVRLGAGTVNR